MGRIIWTEDAIKNKVMEIVTDSGEERMPTYQEIRDYCGDYSLYVAIQRHGGIVNLAHALGLVMKTDNIPLGQGYERYTQGLLEGRGYKIDYIAGKNSYDLLAEKIAKLEVKAARLTGEKNHQRYTFKLKDFPKSDLYIFYCLNDYESINKTYIIPTHELYGLQQLTVGRYASKYDRYLDRWDLIDQLIANYRNLS